MHAHAVQNVSINVSVQNAFGLSEGKEEWRNTLERRPTTSVVHDSSVRQRKFKHPKLIRPKSVVKNLP